MKIVPNTSCPVHSVKRDYALLLFFFFFHQAFMFEAGFHVFLQLC